MQNIGGTIARKLSTAGHDVRVANSSGTEGARKCGNGDALRTQKRGRKRRLCPVILRAATQLFAHRGFEQTTLDQIAKAAGVTKATLYIYFDGKSALIDVVLEQWLCEMSVVRPRCRDLPLRQQLVDVGHQLRELAANPAVVSLTKRLSEVEQRLSPQQMGTWRTRYAEFETHLAGILERHCSCERPSQAAHQFLLLATGDLDAPTPSSHASVGQVEGAVELLLRAYPERPIQGG